MSDECLITLETVVSFYIVYQAVMRKFTLAGKTDIFNFNNKTTFAVAVQLTGAYRLAGDTKPILFFLPH